MMICFGSLESPELARGSKWQYVWVVFCTKVCSMCVVSNFHLYSLTSHIIGTGFLRLGKCRRYLSTEFIMLKLLEVGDEYVLRVNLHAQVS